MGGVGKELPSCLPPTHQGQPQPCRGAQGHSHPPHAMCCRLGAAYRAAPRCAEGNKLGGGGRGQQELPPHPWDEPAVQVERIPAYRRGRRRERI